MRIQLYEVNMSVERWVSFFQEVSGLLETAERRFGIATSVRTDQLIERFELAIQSCTTIAAYGTPNATESTPRSAAASASDNRVHVFENRVRDRIRVRKSSSRSITKSISRSIS